MVYYTRAELENYRRHSMTIRPAAEFFSWRRLNPGDYVDEHISTAAEKNGSPEGDLNRLELKLAEEALRLNYEFLTGVTPSLGTNPVSISAVGFRKR